MDCVEKPVGVIILSESLKPYDEAIVGLDLGARGFSDIDELIECLPALVCAGLILDIPSVMNADSAKRDRLFKLTQSLPILRARRGKNGRAVFLDDLDLFLANCKNVCPSRMRAAKRYPTRLNVLISREDDPAMTNPRPANILNISAKGCYIYALDPFEAASFLYIKILELEDPTPIFGLVRWSKPWGETHALPGMGVAFLDIKDAQAAEIDGGRHFIPNPLEGCSEAGQD